MPGPECNEFEFTASVRQGATERCIPNCILLPLDFQDYVMLIAGIIPNQSLGMGAIFCSSEQVRLE